MSRDELTRLAYGPEPGQKLEGLGSVRFNILCEGDADEVLANAKQVLEAVVKQEPDHWPTLDEWRARLPEWFVERCGKEETRAEAERRISAWKRLPDPEKKRLEAERAWPLSGWLYWFEAKNRYWTWWDAAIANPNQIVVAVETRDWPFPWGALDWLFRASGAMRVTPEE